MKFGPEGKNRFPFGKKERNKELQANAKERRKELTDEDRGSHWLFHDSPLQFKWSNPFRAAYQASFMATLPNNEMNLRRYIEMALASKKGKAVGIDLGGPGSSIFADFSKGFFKKSGGVTLVDHRSEKEVKQDKAWNHDVIEGDIMDPVTAYDVKEWLGNDKVDLVFERLLGAKRVIPNEPYIVSFILEQWYELLAEGGVLFVEIPKNFRPLVQAWADMINKEFPGVIELQVAEATSSFRLRKLPGAPEGLPLLDPRTVRKISRS